MDGVGEKVKERGQEKEGQGRRFETTEKPSLDTSRSLPGSQRAKTPKSDPPPDCIVKMIPATQRNENINVQNRIILTVQTRKQPRWIHQMWYIHTVNYH